jgi:hypothetical protein
VAEPPLLALELRGRSVFIRPPSEAEMITSSATGWAPAEYNLAIEIPQEAGAPLAELTVQQIGGVDGQFPGHSGQRSQSSLNPAWKRRGWVV